GGGNHSAKAQRGVIDNKLPAALRAVLALAECASLHRRDVLGTARDLDILRPPEREGVDRPAGPGTTRTAMTVARGLGRPRDLKLDRTTKAASRMAHRIPSQLLRRRAHVRLDVTIY